MSARTLGLLVAGGQSTRMGSDKAFLPYPLAPGSPTSSTSPNATKEGIEEHTESLWIHLLRILLRVCPEGVVVSHNAGQRGRMEQDLKGFLEDSSLSSSSSSSSSPSNTTSSSTSNSTSSYKQPQLRTPYIELLQDLPDYTDLGPASALLTAHQAHPSTTFLVVAVDFPFVTFDTLQHLLKHHTEPSPSASPSPSSSSTSPEPGPSTSPVTTYFHPSDMHPEPLLSVWGPEGLRRLRRNAIEGVTQADGGLRRRTGPCYTAKELWREIISSEPETEGKVDSDTVYEQTKVEEHGQKNSKPKDNKSKDELPPAIIRRFGVLPKTEGELRNTNTREEWDSAVEELKAGYGLTGEPGAGRG